MEIAQLRGVPITLQFDFEGHPIVIIIPESFLSLGYYAATCKFLTDPEMLADWLARTLISWSLTDESNAWPVTKENVLSCPMSFITALLMCLNKQAEGGFEFPSTIFPKDES